MNQAESSIVTTLAAMGVGVTPHGLGFRVSTRRPRRAYTHKTHQQRVEQCAPHNDKVYKHRFTGQIRMVTVQDTHVSILQFTKGKKRGRLLHATHKAFLSWVKNADLVPEVN